MMKGLAERQIDYVCAYLLEKGKAITRKASVSHETKRRTGNQENAYGCGVYYNGQLKAVYYELGRPAAEKPIVRGGRKYWGREKIREYFSKGMFPATKKGFYLVIVNAMWYSKQNEMINNLRVVTQTYDDLRAAGNNIMTDLGLKNIGIGVI